MQGKGLLLVLHMFSPLALSEGLKLMKPFKTLFYPTPIHSFYHWGVQCVHGTKPNF